MKMKTKLMVQSISDPTSYQLFRVPFLANLILTVGSLWKNGCPSSADEAELDTHF